ncbi:glycosyl hydrolase [Paenibacillus thalictri]|uniref:Glycoside hydrolase n=1 Tax=Paenibacillus thalictri TaxID=2527873 RepID=A0A4Q9DV21_9BACL|nr:glycosyl hydrolase [Paenibacillus thalictri]TBL80114.1 hypothetical protein EYB31_06715 [Paenibacillus thalictri]
MSKAEQLRKQFDNPSSAYRSLPFWSWNDKLDLQELARQVEDMKEQGMGGFFMHSREGLETPYLGPEWMDAVKVSVERAEQLGLKAWLYDEDRWPSGSAGGGVPAQGDEYRSKGLTMEVSADGCVVREDPSVVAVYRAVINGMEMSRCERLDMQASPLELAQDEVLLIMRVEVSQPAEWFNDETPPDSLNADTVRRFIDATYEVYKQRHGDQFGRAIAGIFTDEPSVHDRHCKFTAGRGWVPWTYSFPAYFLEKRGYDVLDVIPYVYFNGDLSTSARHDYWRTVSDQFCESYTKQLGDWCEANKLAFTGHYLWESALGVATRVGGSIMPHYRYQHVPGIDMLCEQTDEYMTVKQCTSVANQYGRPYVLTETYGCAGWEFTFEGQKWIGDWQYVLGVNLRSQHLMQYSIKGCRKRDYPPFFNYQASWWKYNRIVEDYFARIGAVMTEGRPVRDILVLHPASTAWSMLGTSPYGFTARGKDRDIAAVDQYGYEFNDLLRVLLGVHYDFDLGDETIMAETGSVRDGKLWINLAAYKLVVLPPIRTMLQSTHDLLLGFLNAGGKVIAIAPIAAMIEGKESGGAAQLYDHPGMIVVGSREELIRSIEATQQRAVSIRTPFAAEDQQLLYLFKEAENHYSLFVVNNDRKQTHEVSLSIACQGLVEEWDALTGDITTVEAQSRNGRLQFQAKFGPAGSKLYVIHKGSAADHAFAAAKPQQALAVITGDELEHAFPPLFRFTRTNPNVLTLDTCQYRIGEADWSAELEIWRAQQQVRETLGMRQVFYNGITQRYKWIHDEHPNNGTPVSLKLKFHVTEVPAAGIRLVIEGAQQFLIRLNGHPLSNKAEGWYVDRSMDCVPLSGVLTGENELELVCAYTLAMEIEDCFLIGDFGVDLQRSIVKEPETLRFGDWCMQGYFHYNGSIVYHADYHYQPEAGKKLLLQLGDYSAVTIEVRVNGETAGHVPWKAADGVNLTPWLKEGANRLDIEVMGSPRNMFGPFHNAEGHTPTTDWSSFRTTDQSYTPEYLLQPYGLFGQMKLVSRKRQS